MQELLDRYRLKTGDNRDFVEMSDSSTVLTNDGFIVIKQLGQCLFIHAACGNGKALFAAVNEIAQRYGCKYVYAKAARGGKTLARYLNIVGKCSARAISGGEGIMWEVKNGNKV